MLANYARKTLRMKRTEHAMSALLGAKTATGPSRGQAITAGRFHCRSGLHVAGREGSHPSSFRVCAWSPQTASCEPLCTRSRVLLRPQSLNAFDDAFNLLDGGMGVAAGTFFNAAGYEGLQPMQSNTGQRCNGSACSVAAQLGMRGKRLLCCPVQRHSTAVESRPWVELGTQIQT